MEVRQIISESLKGKPNEDLATLTAVAKIPWWEIMEYSDWVFEGSFNNYWSKTSALVLQLSAPWTKRTPNSVGSALFANFKFRFKLLNNLLLDINFYDKVIDIEESTAEFIHESTKKDGFYVPASTDKMQPAFPWLALDNIKTQHMQQVL